MDNLTVNEKIEIQVAIRDIAANNVNTIAKIDGIAKLLPDDTDVFDAKQLLKQWFDHFERLEIKLL